MINYMLFILLCALGLGVFFIIYGILRGDKGVMDDLPAFIINMIFLIIVIVMAILTEKRL